MERAMVPKMQSATLCVLGAGMSFPISAEGLVCLGTRFSVRLRFPFVGRAPPSLRPCAAPQVSQALCWRSMGARKAHSGVSDRGSGDNKE